MSGFIIMYLNGWLFTYKSPNAIMYVLLFCAVALCIHIVIMQVVASRHGERFVKDDIKHDGKQEYTDGSCNMDRLVEGGGVKDGRDDDDTHL